VVIMFASPVHEPTLSHEGNAARNLLEEALGHRLCQSRFWGLSPNELLQVTSSAVLQNEPELVLNSQAIKLG